MGRPGVGVRSRVSTLDGGHGSHRERVRRHGHRGPDVARDLGPAAVLARALWADRVLWVGRELGRDPFVYPLGCSLGCLWLGPDPLARCRRARACGLGRTDDPRSRRRAVRVSGAPQLERSGGVPRGPRTARVRSRAVGAMAARELARGRLTRCARGPGPPVGGHARAPARRMVRRGQRYAVDLDRDRSCWRGLPGRSDLAAGRLAAAARCPRGARRRKHRLGRSPCGRAAPHARAARPLAPLRDDVPRTTARQRPRRATAVHPTAWGKARRRGR